jgi:hypothetical protein
MMIKLHSYIFFLFAATSTTSSSAFVRNAGTAAFLGLQAAAMSDTPTTLPDFNNQAHYLEYMESVSALPKGFATGTASGKFVSVEAPSMGPLPIRGTVIYLTEGPTENWAATFTSNKVCLSCFYEVI